MSKPTVISTFAGGGGSSLGYKWAGFQELLAIDFDKHACETLRLNFNFPVWERDITQAKGAEILEFLNIKKGDLDVLDGSPPCQGFSMAGKRNVNDDRNILFESYIRLINELQPKVFVMENVKGMVIGKMKGMFNDILRALKDTGYNVKCKLMNAKYYQVPQSRERLIFIGVRPDLDVEPSFPIPSKKVITVREAIGDLNNEKGYITPEMKKRWLNLKNGQSVHGFNFFKLIPRKVCPTITKQACHFHYQYPRELNINEGLLLCSFPVDYKMNGNTRDKWERLGNAVMPNMMKAIALNIKENILQDTISEDNNV